MSFFFLGGEHLQLMPRGQHLAGSDVAFGLRFVELLVGGAARFHEGFGAGEGGIGEVERAFGLGEGVFRDQPLRLQARAGGFALRALQRDQLGVEHDERVAGLDASAEIGPDLADAARHGRSDIDLGGLEGARGIDLFAIASATNDDESGEGEEGKA